MTKEEQQLPLYYRIQQSLKKKIEEEWQPGDVIPSERELSEQFQVSRMTVRQAVNGLVDDGFLVRKRGSGTYVNERKVEQILHGVTSFSEEMRARGLAPSNKPVSFQIIPSDEKIAGHLQLKHYDPVYKIERIRLADRLPMAFETTFIPANMMKSLTEEIMNRSLYEYVEAQLGIGIDDAYQTIESSSATKKEAKYLQIKEKDPVLVIKRKTFTTTGTPFEYVRTVYRGDRYKFSIHIKRKKS
ncbi:GntR family transcriptional regulator [Bacillus oleivorans]|uniref:GntR family transcriptional regulator n=1 Tax=Bacillus oleivorans TaxID=1448271 RepID=A0A285CIT4_9BACI|nr:GntR family transcriptional regulator [Bacillus oleivorans]SNX66893.1 GntR family transcriptional regulator [Bacillus oleivorans]